MVEGARLEIVWAGDRLGGSNPLASAIFLLRNALCYNEGDDGGKENRDLQRPDGGSGV